MGEINKIESHINFFYKTFRNILIISISLVIISTIILSLPHSSATGSTSGSDNLAITISSSCTLSSVVNVPHNAEVYNGNYLGDIGKTTITTLCNDGNGYSVYAVGYSNNEEGNNRLVNSERPEYSIDTGLNTSGLTSQWAMKLNNIPDDPSPTPPTIESDYNNTYGIVPPYWTKVAGRASGTTDMAQGSSFTTTYAVYASSSQYAGTYQGQVKYILTHPNSNSQHLFMQDVDTWGNSVLANIGDSIQAIDIRDGKQYWVTRLADGHIWMTQNLDFDIVADEQDPTKMKTLTSEDTDLIDHSLTGAYSEANGYSYDPATRITTWTPVNTAKTINFSGGNNTFVTGWQDSNTVPYSANKTDDVGTGHASLGNYYNWTAAIASNNSSALTNDTLNNISQNPQNSICPKGWRLPTISNASETATDFTNEFARLNYLYNSGLTNTGVAWFNSPLYFVAGGLVDNNNRLASIGTSGCYNSSTVSTSKQAYRMCINPNSASMADGGAWALRGRGNTVRCVAR